MRFLNDIGGGKVVGFNGQNEVIVEQEDGFGFPIAVSECVVVSSGQSKKDQTQTATQTSVQTSVVQEAQSYGSKNNDPDQLNVYLAFAPSDIEALDSSDIDLYLINNSDYSLFFSLLEKQEKGYKCRKNTLVRPNENLFIEQVARVNLASLENLHVQIIALKGAGQFKVHQPIDRQINTKLVKFCKSSSFSFSAFLGCPAMSIDLNKDPQILDVEALKQSLVAINKDMSEPKNQKHSPLPKSDLLEIDLHIDSLLDSTKGMSSGDMLEYQLSYFKKIMAENERFTGKKIVFIHGKGDGVLRSSLERELKRMGRGNRYQQASFKKYGYGAIMVII